MKEKKEYYFSFPVLIQLSSASGRKVRTIAYMKGAKQHPAFPKESPETTAQIESNLFQYTRMNYVSRNLLLQEVRLFLTLSSYTTNILRKATFGKYKLHTRTMWREVNFVWNTTSSLQLPSIITSVVFISFYKQIQKTFTKTLKKSQTMFSFCINDKKRKIRHLGALLL